MRESRASVTLVALALGLVVACSGSAQPGRAPARSPSLDYPAPAQETSQGEVVGADRIPPGDKLRQGARVGPGGITPAEGPATSAPKGPTSEPQGPSSQPNKSK